jgi:hypothetical protein
MALSNREQKILYITVALVGAVVLWWGVAPIWDSYTELRADLEAEKRTFDNNKAVLQRTEQIEEEFRRVEAQFPDVEEGRSPDFAFSEDVAAAVESILPGERRPVIQPVQSEAIKNVTDYEFLNLTMTVTGEYEKLAQLLKGFDQKGFLIKSITLDHSNPDKPELSLDITLARIVKLEEETEEGGGRIGRRPGGRRI